MLLLRREHEAIVNHQLCITNTFEQVFKEKMLKLYKKVRYLCNTHLFRTAFGCTSTKTRCKCGISLGFNRVSWLSCY